MRTAYAIETPRLLLRAYDPADAATIAPVVAEHREDLRRFMGFAAREPEVGAYVDLFVEFRRRFTEGDYTFSVWEREGAGFAGGCGLHPQVGPRGREVGYWVTPPLRGRGYAGELVAALCHLAFCHEADIDRVELRIEPANAPSIRVAEKAGFTREALLRRRHVYAHDDLRDVLVYTLFAHEHPAHPVLPLRFLDAGGLPIPAGPGA